MTEKQCFKCLQIKPLDDFYAHPQMGDGHLNKCKDCTKKDTMENRLDNLEYYLEYDRQRANLPHRVTARKEYERTRPEVFARLRKKWELNNPEKKKAATAVGNAVRDGRLEKKSFCELCGATGRIEGHHEGYNKPLEVIWLCKKHHVEADEQRRERELREELAFV